MQGGCSPIIYLWVAPSPEDATGIVQRAQTLVPGKSEMTSDSVI